ncbi:hypothetical protein BaRGS_00028673 [Batillaria attramentaria]|uniref:Uncharacterized protein n=1 Tax=Batillaria attramentaria TaxID=370345 RepID=A0ABD0JZ61_9CAEN
MAFRRRLPKCGTSLFLCFILLLALLCVLHRASNRSLSFHYKLTIDGIKAAWTRQLTGDLSAVQCRQQSHDVISDVSLVRTNEDFLIPYFQSRKVKAREGLCVRHEAPGTEFERQLLSTSPLGSIESAPDELTSQVRVET